MDVTRDLGVFLLHAVVLEDEAAQRYDELAEAMEAHNNPEVAGLFRKMAAYSRLHLAEAVERAERAPGGLPDLKPWELTWADDESPEAGPAESHYLMTPHHALKLALAAECSARDFYADVAERAADAALEQLAGEFAAEEAEHTRALEKWLERYPAPPEGWDEDPDPPAAAD